MRRYSRHQQAKRLDRKRRFEAQLRRERDAHRRSERLQAISRKVYESPASRRTAMWAAFTDALA